MSPYRDEQSKIAPTYASLFEMQEQSRRQQRKLYGWVGTRFYEVYPGFRTIDHTDFVRPAYTRQEEQP